MGFWLVLIMTIQGAFGITATTTVVPKTYQTEEACRTAGASPV
jgi:hypothetical protein